MQIHRMLQLLTTRVFLHSTYRHLVHVQYYLDNMMMASSAQLPMIFSLYRTARCEQPSGTWATNWCSCFLVCFRFSFTRCWDWIWYQRRTTARYLATFRPYSPCTKVHALVHCTQLQWATSYLIVVMYMYVPFECALITTDPLPLCRPSSEVPRDEIGWRVHWSRWEHVTAVGEQLVIWALVCTTYSVYHCTGSYIALHFVEHSVHQVYDIPNTPL